MSSPGVHTDDELVALDVPALSSDGLAPEQRRGPHARRWLFAEGAVAAAIWSDRAGVHARSLTFLAEVVRRGGIAFAAELPEPLPTPEQSAVARVWLTAAQRAAPADDVDTAPEQATVFARWLDAVAMLLEARQAPHRAGG
jgi:hypothetical protein